MLRVRLHRRSHKKSLRIRKRKIQHLKRQSRLPGNEKEKEGEFWKLQWQGSLSQPLAAPNAELVNDPVIGHLRHGFRNCVANGTAVKKTVEAAKAKRMEKKKRDI